MMKKRNCRYSAYKLVVLFCTLIALMMMLPPTRVSAQSICNGAPCGLDGSAIDITDIKNQIATTPRFVSQGEFISQNTLRTNFPCGPGETLGKYARVLDMYQTVSSVAICETDGNTYYWRPQRTDYATVSNQTTGTINLVPFVTSPVVVLSNSPTGNITITPSNTNAWPGAQFRVIMPATINILYGINISGLIGNNVITALQGRDYVITYTANGWKSN